MRGCEVLVGGGGGGTERIWGAIGAAGCIGLEGGGIRGSVGRGAVGMREGMVGLSGPARRDGMVAAPEGRADTETWETGASCEARPVP